MILWDILQDLTTRKFESYGQGLSFVHASNADARAIKLLAAPRIYVLAKKLDLWTTWEEE